MRKYLYLTYDLLCIGVSLILALYLRHGFPLIQEGRPEDLYLILYVTLGVAFCVLPLMQTHVAVWRYTSYEDLTSIMIAVGLVILISNSGFFLISRLEMMPRSVPPMQWALTVVLIGGSRLLARKILGFSKEQQKPARVAKVHVLVVGVGHVAELYLQFIKRIIRGQVTVEGFLDEDASLIHRAFQKYKILGTPDTLPKILEDLHVHGIHISQVILAQPLEKMSPATIQTLLDLERKKLIELVHFDKHIGPSFLQHKASQTDPRQLPESAPRYHYTKTKDHYSKRIMDIVGASVLIILTLPLMLLTTLLVALDVGFPVLFWQQRPGRFGKPFRLYKFRTMRQAGWRLGQDRLTQKTDDTKRMSVIGKWIRHLRLDEFPQLFHIISGKMSFVGPRPLLKEDQPEQGEARLSVRPGITGWAQIHGGDALSAEEKLVLDIWYIDHMSLWLDIRILFKTLLVICKPDKARMVGILPSPESSVQKIKP